jgi:NAD(P)-dependent dehydrogenase (short-subunit alcohol dehydrogenase family)
VPQTAIPTPLTDYHAPDDLLLERFILVTGAADGIGRAVATACARLGATVLALDRKRRKLEILYDSIVDAGLPEPILIPHDLSKSDPASYENLAGGIAHDAGRLDGIAHIAGILPGFSPLHSLNLKEWSSVMQVNLYAPYLLTRACLPLLGQAESASVVFTSASAGRHGRAFWGAYAVAYGGVERMSEVWADELENSTSIRFNTLDPGPVGTDMRSRNFPGELLTEVPPSEHVVPAYLFLLGHESAILSGQAFSAQAPARETTRETTEETRPQTIAEDNTTR